MKQAMKKSAGSSGIMSLNKNLVNDVETQVSKWVKSAKTQGQDIDKMGEQELKYIVELNKPKEPRTLQELMDKIGLNDPKKNRFLQKEGEVVKVDFDKNNKWFKGKNVEGQMEKINKASNKINEIKKEQAAMYKPKVDTVEETVTYIKTLEPITAMKEANLVIGRKGKYKDLTPEQSKKILQDTEDHIFERDIPIDPEDLAQGGRTGTGLNYLLGEDDQNSRVPFGAGGFGRRAFLKLMAGAGAGIGAAKTGLFGLLKGGAKTTALTKVPIKAGVDGMPEWFMPLVNRVIREGDDVSKKFATQDRQIVNQATLPDSKTDVLVTQDLTTGNVSVDIGLEKHGFSSGKFGQPVRLEYQASEVIEPNLKTGKGGGKTKEEFWVEEAEFTGGHPENIKFEESTIEKFGKHESDFSEVEAFAKGKRKKDARKVSESFNKEGEDIADHFSNYPKPDDYASGGRVSLSNGGIAGMLGE